MRNAYLNALYNLAKNDERVVSLVADNGLIVYDDFRRDFPERYFNFGISEENMVAASAGMASCGLIPFVYTISAFLAYRSYEFIRNDVCYQNQNVKIVGIGTGLTYSTLGPSHHTTEDIGILRGIPNLTVFSPATAAEMKWMMQEAYQIQGPVYIRLGNNNMEYYGAAVKFEKGNPSVICEGDDIVIFTTGTIINEVMKAAEMLKCEQITARVVSVHTLKPMNTKAIAALLESYRKAVVVEEHNVIGGLYTMLAEAMVEEQVSIPVLKIGLQDVFAVDYGNIQNVRQANRLGHFEICAEIRKFYREEIKL